LQYGARAIIHEQLIGKYFQLREDLKKQIALAHLLNQESKFLLEEAYCCKEALKDAIEEARYYNESSKQVLRSFFPQVRIKT
jgi:hypothetical protein